MRLSRILGGLLLLPALANAQALCTLETVRGQAGAVWQETIETPWRTVEIAAPITLPEAGKMPLLLFRQAEEAGESGECPGPGWTVETGAETWGVRIMREGPGDDAPGHPESTHFYAPVDMDMVLSSYGQSLRALTEEMEEVLESVNHGRFSWQTKAPYDVMVNTRTEDGEKEERQTWVNLLLYQTFEGVPLLNALPVYMDGNGREVHLHPSPLNMGMSPQGEMRISYRPFSSETLVEDLPLCSLEAVQETLRTLVREGKVRRILEMRLGYVFYEDGEDELGRYGVGLPAWQVECWYCKSGDQEMGGEDPVYPTNSRGKKEYRMLAVNAQTGELIGQRNEDTVFPGVIAWGDEKRRGFE